MSFVTWQKIRHLNVGNKLRLLQESKIYRDDQVISLTQSGTTAAQHYIHGNGRDVVLNRANGLTFNLPRNKGDGKRFSVYVGTAITGLNAYAIGTLGNSTFTGTLFISSDTTCDAYYNTVQTAIYLLVGQGGKKGDVLYFVDAGVNYWQVTGFLSTTGAGTSNPWNYPL